MANEKYHPNCGGTLRSTYIVKFNTKKGYPDKYTTDWFHCDKCKRMLKIKLVVI